MGEYSGWSNYCQRSVLMDPSSGFLTDDVLILELHITVWQDKMSTTCCGLGSASFPRDGTLAEDMGKLFHSGQHSDLTVRIGPTVGGEGRWWGPFTGSSPANEAAAIKAKVFRVHRLVLAARSTVLMHMLIGSGMKETVSNGELVLEDDLEPKVVEWFLNYIYTDKIEEEAWEDDEAMCHLLSLAHKYQMMSLQRMCLAKIVAKLSEDNASERLMMADHFQIPTLQEAVLDYMCLTTVGFARLAETRPQLLRLILAHSAPPTLKRSADCTAEVLPTDLEALRVVDLKRLCGDRGLSTSGTKVELVGRLRVHMART